MKHSCAAGTAILGMASLVAMLVTAAGSAQAAATNTVPKSWSFEEETVGASIVVSNSGWYAADTNAAIVQTGVPDMPPGGYPLATNHTKILEVSDALTNLIESATDTTVYLDTLINARQWDQEAPPEDLPADTQVAVYVNTNDNLVVYHKIYGSPSNQWTAVTETSVETGSWHRLTIEIDYNLQDFFKFHRYFQVYLDGVPVSSPEARTDKTGSGSSQAGGTWFPLAVAENHMSAFLVRGTGLFDDIQVVTDDPNNAVVYTIAASVDDSNRAFISPMGSVRVAESNDQVFTIGAFSGYSVTGLLVNGTLMDPTNSYLFAEVTSNQTIHVLSGANQGTTDMGVPYAWLSQYGLGEDDMGDPDGDGALTWEEYVAGTIPVLPDGATSTFMIMEQGHGSPSNYVVYYCTTNSGVTEPVDIYRSTNLMDETAWELVQDNWPRDPSGTNTWWDTNPPTNAPAFYKTEILWVVP